MVSINDKLGVAFIYNKTDRIGNFSGIYYDNIHNLNSKISFINNGKKEVKEISSDQSKEIEDIINWFVMGSTSYEEDGNEETDHYLLAHVDRNTNYYYWKNDDHIPKGIERLLEFVNNIRPYSVNQP